MQRDTLLLKEPLQMDFFNVRGDVLVSSQSSVRAKNEKLFDCPLITCQEMGRSVGEFFFTFFFFKQSNTSNINPTANTHISICS